MKDPPTTPMFQPIAAQAADIKRHRGQGSQSLRACPAPQHESGAAPLATHGADRCRGPTQKRRMPGALEAQDRHLLHAPHIGLARLAGASGGPLAPVRDQPLRGARRRKRRHVNPTAAQATRTVMPSCGRGNRTAVTHLQLWRTTTEAETPYNNPRDHHGEGRERPRGYDLNSRRRARHYPRTRIPELGGDGEP